jgi:transposase
MKYYTTIYVGLDVHKDTIFTAALNEATGEVVANERIPNDPAKLRKHLRSIERRNTARLEVCYEAGCFGYALQRKIEEWGYPCKIVAPSLIPRKPGDRKKNDRRDSLKLAASLARGDLTFVRVPEKEEEPIRDLLRLRTVLMKEAVKSRHYVLKFVLRKGYRYTGGKMNWTVRHWKWLRELRFESPVEQEVFEEYLSLLDFKLMRIAELDRKIEELADSAQYREAVKLIRAFRGMDVHSAMVLLVEICDFERFDKARNFSSFLGLVPSERSSGENHRLGHITKTGNSHCRHVLVQAAWNYSRPVNAENLKNRLKGLPAWVTTSVMTAQKRLTQKYWKLARAQGHRIGVVAVARELGCFIWGAMKRLQQEKRMLAEV